MIEGWSKKKFGDIAKIKGGKRIPKGQKLIKRVTSHPYIRVKDFNENGSVDLSDIHYLKEEVYEEIKNYTISAKDVYISIAGTIGKTGIVPKELDGANLTENACKLILDDSVYNKYLLFFTFSDDFKNQVGLNTRTTAMPKLALSRLSTIKVNIPPLEEQKQIVAILDKAFEAIDKAKANLEKNIANAKELFQSKLNEIFSQKGEGWEEKKLVHITSKIGSGATPRGGQASYKESGISLIRSLNVYDDGFRIEKLAFIDEIQAKKLDNVELEEGDVLLNITGASIARCCIVPNKYLPARVNQHVSIIRLKDNIVNNEFLHYYLTSKNKKYELLGIGEKGATRQAITKAQIQNLKIIFPKSIEEQLNIVHALNNIRKLTEKVEYNYLNNLNKLEDLKKSILQKAFSGELTSNKAKSAILDNLPMAAEDDMVYESVGKS
ncbi:MAG: hypothetical protein CMO01_04660 [Thalassobius sp.]|nr:hypothetical protein [Thalassovita sp.]